VRKNKPEQLQIAIECLSEGLDIAKTCRASRLCRDTVMKIQQEYQDEIGPLKQQMAEQFRRSAVMSVTVMNDYLQRHLDPNDDYQLPPNLAPIYGGVATDKALLLAGEATSRHEEVKRDYSDLEEVFSTLPPKAKPIIDITPEKK
jgi:hypothetical protein